MSQGRSLLKDKKNANGSDYKNLMIQYSIYRDSDFYTFFTSASFIYIINVNIFNGDVETLRNRNVCVIL